MIEEAIEMYGIGVPMSLLLALLINPVERS